MKGARTIRVEIGYKMIPRMNDLITVGREFQR